MVYHVEAVYIDGVTQQELDAGALFVSVVTEELGNNAPIGDLPDYVVSLTVSRAPDVVIPAPVDTAAVAVDAVVPAVDAIPTVQVGVDTKEVDGILPDGTVEKFVPEA